MAAEQVAALGPWFHDLEIREVRTAPDHRLGSFLPSIWSIAGRHIPEDLSGTTLSIQAHPAQEIYPCAPPADAGTGQGAPP